MRFECLYQTRLEFRCSNGEKEEDHLAAGHMLIRHEKSATLAFWYVDPTKMRIAVSVMSLISNLPQLHGQIASANAHTGICRWTVDYGTINKDTNDSDTELVDDDNTNNLLQMIFI